MPDGRLSGSVGQGMGSIPVRVQWFKVYSAGASRNPHDLDIVDGIKYPLACPLTLSEFSPLGFQPRARRREALVRRPQPLCDAVSWEHVQR